jgi:hypothetical protein
MSAAVIFDRRDTPTRTVGLSSTAERLDIVGQSGSSTFESFFVRSAPTTEEIGPGAEVDDPRTAVYARKER